jgi:hypothetical protein
MYELMSLAGIPTFPDSRPITLADRVLIDGLFAKHPADISERTFGSIFIWRNYGGRSDLSQLDGHLIVSWYKWRFGRTVLPPIGPDTVGTIEVLMSHEGFESQGFAGVFGLLEPEVHALKIKGRVPETLRDEWDYVYRTEDLVKLEGPKYHTQRKELGKATSQFQVAFEPMNDAHRNACLALEETWCDLKHCSLDKLSAAEDSALKESLDHLKELGFFGGVAVIDGKIQALTVGERLNANTAVVHFEKANPAIRGLYQFINQQFCERLLKDFEFVNREQDVGEPGLRRAKEGYHPHHFAEKHILLTGRGTER